MRLKKPDIFRTDGFRTYLREYYEFRKSTNPRFSYALFTRLLGFKSRSFIQEVIANRKNIGLAALESFRKIFVHEPQEFAHFQKLVLLDQSSGKKKKALGLEVERERSVALSKDLSEAEYFFYTDWYFVPIYFLPTLPDFRDDATWIRDRMKYRVTLGEVNLARKKLLQFEFWKKDEDGRITLTGPKTSRVGVRRDLLKKYHSKMLELARVAADLPFKERFVSGSTFQLTPSQLEEVRKLLMDFKELNFSKYVETHQAEEGAEVYHLSLAVFPLTGMAKGLHHL